MDAHRREVRLLRSMPIRTDAEYRFDVSPNSADWCGDKLSRFCNSLSTKKPQRPVKPEEIERLVSETSENENRVGIRLNDLAAGWLDGDSVTAAHNEFLDTQKAMRFYYEIPASCVFDDVLPVKVAGRTYREWTEELNKSLSCSTA